jgi:hypothetical protein
LIVELIHTAFQMARLHGRSLTNSERSTAWVKYLAGGLRARYQSEPVTVFSRDFSGNRSEFRLNEFLFDIVVSEVIKVDAVRGKSITAVTGVRWLVESEFKRTDCRDLIVDFNKLVIGNSENKLLVIAAGSPLTDWAKKVIPGILGGSTAKFFLGIVPHPDDWYSSECPSIEVFEFSSSKWILLNSGLVLSASVEL